jgi:hypothetical protein
LLFILVVVSLSKPLTFCVLQKGTKVCTTGLYQFFEGGDGPVAGLVGIEGGVVSGVFNLESSGVEAPDWRPRHDEDYHEA